MNAQKKKTRNSVNPHPGSYSHARQERPRQFAMQGVRVLRRRGEPVLQHHLTQPRHAARHVPVGGEVVQALCRKRPPHLEPSLAVGVHQHFGFFTLRVGRLTARAQTLCRQFNRKSTPQVGLFTSKSMPTDKRAFVVDMKKGSGLA